MMQTNEQVENELEKLVSILTEVVPQLKEVRVFGSYNNGNWNPEKSDVDVFVETSNSDYSRKKFLIKYSWIPFLPILDIHESSERKNMRKEIMQKLGNNPSELSINFFSSDDVQIFRENYRSVMIDIIKAMKSGRLLYQNKQNQATN